MAQTQTEELLEELDALKRRKGGASKEYEASLGTIKELRMRLVSAEEESGKLQRQLNALPAGDIPRHPAPRAAAEDVATGGGGGGQGAQGNHEAALRVVELEAALQQEQAKTASLEEQLKGRGAGGGKRPKKKGGGSRALPTLSRCGEAVLTAVVVPVRGYVQLRGWRWRQEAGLACVVPEAFWQRSGVSVDFSVLVTMFHVNAPKLSAVANQ